MRSVSEKTSRRMIVSAFIALWVSGAGADALWASAGPRFELGVAGPTPVAGEPAVPAPLSFAHGGAAVAVELRAAVAELEKDLERRAPDRESLAELGRLQRELAAATGEAAAVRKAADAFIRAADLGLAEGRVLYTREISELLVDQRDATRLYDVFARLLALPEDQDRGGHYLALVDFADGLARLDDEAAWGYFEQALDRYPENPREALHRYADHLLAKGRTAAALDLLESRLTSDERLRFFAPVFQRREAMARLGLDTRDAEAEIAALEARSAGSMGMLMARKGEKGPVKLESMAGAFSHTAAADDCRNALTATNCTPDGFGNCFYTVAINLAELLWNEARSERIGAQDMVGWTVRDRSFQRMKNSCDVYVGAEGSGQAITCRAAVPCSDPNFCDESRRYCCVMHGGTTTVGASHLQFNDAHVSFANLVSSQLIYEAVYILNGWVPELSTGFVPFGVFSCSFSCDSPFCFFGSNVTSPSPSGPHEYLNRNYCAKVAANCKTYKKNVCGQNAVPANLQCSDTSNNRYVGDNFFWNRIP